MVTSEEKPPKTLWGSSGYGVKTKEPFVNIAMPGGEYVQLDIEGARHHALAVLECAEAAVQDAFLVEWVKDATKTNDQGAGVLLNEYREWRKRRKI